jgi:hypothetical protein
MDPGRALSPALAAGPGPSPRRPDWLSPPSTVSAAMCTALWTAGAGLAVFPVHKLVQEA